MFGCYVSLFFSFFFLLLPLPVYRFLTNTARGGGGGIPLHSRCHSLCILPNPFRLVSCPSVATFCPYSTLTCRYNIRAITMTQCNETPDRTYLHLSSRFFLSYYACGQMRLPVPCLSVCVRACQKQKRDARHRDNSGQRRTVTEMRTMFK